MKRLTTIVLTLLFLVSASAFADDAAEAGKSLTVRTFQFKFKKAENAAAVIKPLMGEDATISIRATSLVVTDLPQNLKKIAATLDEFDAETQPFRLSMRIVSAARAAASEARVRSEERRVGKEG